jgi:hypothetical protein
MKDEPVKAALRCLGLGLVLVAIVGLLTLIFSFLGTLSCAALGGLMLGAMRHRRWLSLPVSLVFPAVVFALMQLSKVELHGHKRIVVPALCFGLFWLTYLVTRAMAGAEHNDSSADTQAGHGPGVRRSEAGSGTLGAERQTLVSGMTELRLEHLEGRWRCEAADSGRIREKVIEIAGGHLILRGFSADGKERLRVEGEVRLENSQPGKVIVQSAKVEV